MSYYYPSASRGTSYYDLDETPAGRIAPVAVAPQLLTPPPGPKSP